MDIDLTQSLKIGDIVPTRANAFAKIVSLTGNKKRPIVTIVVDPLTGKEGLVKQHYKNGKIYTGYNKSPFDLMPEKTGIPVWVALDALGRPIMYEDEAVATAVHSGGGHSSKLTKVLLFNEV